MNKLNMLFQLCKLTNIKFSLVTSLYNYLNFARYHNNKCKKHKIFMEKLIILYKIYKLLKINVPLILLSELLSNTLTITKLDEDNNTILHIIFLCLTLNTNLTNQDVNKIVTLLQIIYISIKNHNSQLTVSNFIKHQNNNGFSAINILHKIYAVNPKKYFQIVKHFLRAFDQYKLDRLERTVLHYSILLCPYNKQQKFLNKIIKPIIKNNNNIVNMKDKYGYNILHYAISRGYEVYNISSYFIYHYPHLTYEKSKNGNTTLHLLAITNPFHIYHIIFSKAIKHQLSNPNTSSLKSLKHFFKNYTMLAINKENNKLKLLKKYENLQNQLLQQMKIKHITCKNNDKKTALDIIHIQQNAKSYLQDKNYISKAIGKFFYLPQSYSSMPIFSDFKQELSSLLKKPLFKKIIYDQLINNYSQKQINFTHNTNNIILYNLKLYHKLKESIKLKTKYENKKHCHYNQLIKAKQNNKIISYTLFTTFCALTTFRIINNKSDYIFKIIFYFTFYINIYLITINYNFSIQNNKSLNIILEIEHLNRQIKNINNKPSFSL